MIIGIFGNLSSGKTVTAVKLCYDEYKKEDKITISNIKLKFPPKEQKKPVLNYIRISMENLLKKAFDDNVESKMKYFYDKNILLDEAHNILDARKSSSNLNTAFTQFVTQIGKMDCNLIMTSQMFSSQIDLRVRELCNMIIYCERVDKEGNSIYFANRIAKEKIYIKLIWILNKWGLEGQMSRLNPTGELIFDPEPYYSLYDTREIVLIDREKFKGSEFKRIFNNN